MSKPVRKKNSTLAHIVGVSMIAVGALLLLLVALGNVLGPVGIAIKGFFLGAFGLSFYAFMAATIVMGIFLLRGMKPSLGALKIVSIVGVYVLAVMLLHLVTTRKMFGEGVTFGKYITDCYASNGTFGGVLYGVFVYPVRHLVGEAFSYILYVFLAVVLGFAWTDFALFKGSVRPRKKKTTSVIRAAEPTVAVRPEGEAPFVRESGEKDPIGMSSAHSLFVDEIYPTARKEEPKSAPIPKYAPSGRPLRTREETGGVRGGMSAGEFEPISQYREPYPKTPVRAQEEKQESKIVMPYVAPPAPQCVVHSSESTPEDVVIINGEARSEELELQRRREEKLAEAERRLEAEQAIVPETHRAPPPVQGEIIIGDEESERILSARKAREEAAARINASRPAAVAPAFGRSHIFDRPIEPTKEECDEPAEIRLPPPPPTFEKRVSEELEEYGRKEQERRNASVRTSDPLEKEESFHAEYRTEETQDRPTDGLDFGRAFQGARHDEAGDAPARREQPTRNAYSLMDLLSGAASRSEENERVSADIERRLPEEDEPTEQRAENLPPIQVAPVDAFVEDEDAYAPVEEKPEPEPERRAELLRRTEFTREQARKQLGMDDYRQQIAQETFRDDSEVLLYPTSGKYVYPPVDLLRNSSTYTKEITEDIQHKAELLVEKLQEFKVPCQVTGICRGPAVSRYELQMAEGVTVGKIGQYAADIAYALEANGGIRIEAPIPGKRAVGVEVPNEKIGIVSLREILESKEFSNSKNYLDFAVGTDIGGKKIICNLGKMPHLLIAGSTGSGKSSCLNSLIVSLITHVSPEDVRMILVDPKHVEFQVYNGLPHLLLEKAITEWSNALNALDWLIQEYERRYRVFSAMHVRSIAEYRSHPDVQSGKCEKLPYIVVVIDELADLMASNKTEFEDKIRAIAQKARAAGIHMVIATQRPSADVITGTIKANLPSRIAFKVASAVDSRVILDQHGAENLCGLGDMLYSPMDSTFAIRVQGAYVSNEECMEICSFITQHNRSVYSEEIYNAVYPKTQEVESPSSDADGAGGISTDPLMLQVLWYFIENNFASTSRVQRKFRVGFNRAANIVDELEYGQFIGPTGSGGSGKERAILITKEEFIERFGEPTWL